LVTSAEQNFKNYQLKLQTDLYITILQ